MNLIHTSEHLTVTYNNSNEWHHATTRKIQKILKLIFQQLSALNKLVAFYTAGQGTTQQKINKKIAFQSPSCIPQSTTLIHPHPSTLHSCLHPAIVNTTSNQQADALMWEPIPMSITVQSMSLSHHKWAGSVAKGISLSKVFPNKTKKFLIWKLNM